MGRTVTAVVTHDGALRWAGRPVPGRDPVVGRGRAGGRASGGGARRAGRRLAAAHGRRRRRSARRARHLPRGGTRATGEADPVRLRRRRSPAPAALGARVGRARPLPVGSRARRAHRAARPAQDLEPVGAVPAANRRRAGLAQGHPSLRRRRAGRDRRVRRGRPRPGAGRAGQRARPPAACRRPRVQTAGTPPRRSRPPPWLAWPPPRPASASRRPPSPTVARRRWRRPSAICSTARSGPS